MTTIYMREIAAGQFRLVKSGQNVGHVRASKQRPGEFVAVMGDLMSYAPTAAEAFHDVMARSNRIELCGEDNKEKARAALQARNDQIAAAAAEFNQLAGYRAYRVRNSRISL